MPVLFVAPFAQLSVGADQRELYVYVTRWLRAFEQAVLAKACERNAAVGGLSEDAHPRGEDNTPPHQGAPLPSDVAEAVVVGLRENMLQFERLEEMVER